jgi:hypothetical protein
VIQTEVLVTAMKILAMVGLEKMESTLLAQMRKIPVEKTLHKNQLLICYL